MHRNRTLVLDGALGYSIVAIVDAIDGRYDCVAEDEQYELPLLQRIARLLPNEADRADLSAIIAGTGPGSYSGIRMAASVAVGLASALDVSLRESPSDRALWQALHRPLAIALGTRESLEISEMSTAIVPREKASELVTPSESRGVYACALVSQAGADVPHVSLRYPAPARGSEGG